MCHLGFIRVSVNRAIVSITSCMQCASRCQQGCLQIFGATEDDVAALQIVSLQDVDLDTMEAMFDDKD